MKFDIIKTNVLASITYRILIKYNLYLLFLLFNALTHKFSTRTYNNIRIIFKLQNRKLINVIKPLSFFYPQSNFLRYNIILKYCNGNIIL